MGVTPLQGAAPAARGAPRRKPAAAGVRYSRAVADAICAAVAAGESQVALCARPGMPSRPTLRLWTQKHPEFAEAFARARAEGGVAQANGRASSYNEAQAGEIYARLCEGESLSSICEDPAMPAFSTVYAWRRRHADFEAMLRTAREVQAERFCDLGWEIAQGVTPKTAKAVAVQLGQLRWTAAVLAPKRYGRLKPLDADVPRPVTTVLIRTFRAEPGPDGTMRVVSYAPDPETGEVVREMRPPPARGES